MRYLSIYTALLLATSCVSSEANSSCPKEINRTAFAPLIKDKNAHLPIGGKMYKLHNPDKDQKNLPTYAAKIFNKTVKLKEEMNQNPRVCVYEYREWGKVRSKETIWSFSLEELQNPAHNQAPTLTSRGGEPQGKDVVMVNPPKVSSKDGSKLPPPPMMSDRSSKGMSELPPPPMMSDRSSKGMSDHSHERRDILPPPPPPPLAGASATKAPPAPPPLPLAGTSAPKAKAAEKPTMSVGDEILARQGSKGLKNANERILKDKPKDDFDNITEALKKVHNAMGYNNDQNNDDESEWENDADE